MLVVCPYRAVHGTACLSVLTWLTPCTAPVPAPLCRQDELERFAPDLSVVAYTGTAAARRAIWEAQVGPALLVDCPRLLPSITSPLPPQNDPPRLLNDAGTQKELLMQ